MPMPGVAGYWYDEQLGSDRVLDPGEVSDGKLWRFRTEDQGPFSFAMRIDAGTPPVMAVIAGGGFWDENRNGVRDEDEWHLPGFVRVTAPDSTVATLTTDRSGFYYYPLHTTGLHVLHFEPMIDTLAKTEEDRFAPIAWSTPNPLHVLITPGPDGEPRGFHEAHFGAYADLPAVPRIRLTDTPVDSLHREPWQLIQAALHEHDMMSYEVGFSGCEPGHVFSLWATSLFMESNPPQANIVLVHETAEPCDMAMQGGYLFDLGPLADAYRAAYGSGTLILNVFDYEGRAQRLEWMVEDIHPPNGG
jgi:hypothetical protein